MKMFGIPAQEGIQPDSLLLKEIRVTLRAVWIPACAGMTEGV